MLRARAGEDAEHVRDSVADHSHEAVSDCLTIQGLPLSEVDSLFETHLNQDAVYTISGQRCQMLSLVMSNLLHTN